VTVRIASGTSGRRLLLVATSFLVHLWLLLASKIFADAIPFGDLSLYNFWAFEVSRGAEVPGIGTDWVYPALAFVPIWLSFLLGFLEYEIAWLSLVFVLNSSAVLLLDAVRPAGKANYASWSYLAVLMLLGPVAVARIDSISAVLAIFGIVALAQTRSGQASLWFTLAGWIKIWPIALFLAMLAAFRSRVRMLAVAAGVSLGILIAGLVFGNGAVVSFLFSQSERGIQIESVMATPWLWLAKFDLASIYFDQTVLTNQVSGALVSEVSQLANWALLIALVITFGLAVLALARGGDRISVFSVAALTAVLDLIVFNKVGSPQFMIWLAVAILVGIYFRQSRWRFVYIAGGSVLVLTQLIYPVFYLELLGLQLEPLILITVRNLLLVALLVWGNLRLGSKQLLQQRSDFVGLN
jgi:hypothetical protein